MTFRRFDIRRPLLALVLSAVAALALVALNPAQAQAQDTNAAIAVNTKDGSSVFDFAFAIRGVTGDVVDQTNAAVAYASCTDCQTVAIALQIVLVESDPSVVTPTNLAVAMNVECATCLTVALAYQFVVGNGGPVRFTAEGRREIARIRREFKRLRKLGLPLDELNKRVEGLIERVRVVLQDELVPVGREGAEQDGVGRDDEAPREGDEPVPEEQPEQTTPEQTTPTEPPPDDGSTTEPEGVTPAPSG